METLHTANSSWLIVGISATAIIYIILLTSLFIESSRGYKKTQVIREFHNAICTIALRMFNRRDTTYLEKSYKQLKINFDQLFDSVPHNKDSILDIIEIIITYYDAKSDKAFRALFKQRKNHDVREFIIAMHSYIKTQYPFISLPKKEADLLTPIMDTYQKNDDHAGIANLGQLAQEIANRERTIARQTRQNQWATMLSIIGIIMTIFFGLLSIALMFR